ncbi:MAG TPA: response regulator transcription factor [Bacteroidales bacterium]|jgi:DNA-binding response OmpR family regulator|nr:response regulator transcription factor [Bacteroidales bacterium]
MITRNAINILVVDDEEDICEILKFNLESEGFNVDTFNSAEEVLGKKLEKYQLFLLDIMMKGMSGYRLADEIRKKRKLSAPILFITAKNTENDKLTGFSVGADDYITKPFSIKEVVARIKAVLRRSDSNNEEITVPARIKIEGIELDLEKKRLIVDGIKEDLTPIEFQLLQILMRNPGRIYGRDQILNNIWRDVNVTDRTVDVHITRLRKKLGGYGNYLVTRKGHGYCFEIN